MLNFFSDVSTKHIEVQNFKIILFFRHIKYSYNGAVDTMLYLQDVKILLQRHIIDHFMINGAMKFTFATKFGFTQLNHSSNSVVMR